MKKIITLSAALLFPIAVSATAQEGDILIWKGDTLSVFSNPLELRQDMEALRPKLFGNKEASMNTACWRGYIAEWTIVRDELYLTNIFSCNYASDSVKADLEKLFGTAYKDGKVSASWVTGELLIPKGRLIQYVHMAYSSFYEYELALNFEEGVLTEQTLYDNSKSHQSVFTEDPDSLQRFIYSNIDWKRIPDLQDEKVRVVLSVISGEAAKADNITIIRGADNELLTNEAIRVVRMLPDWDVYYRRGEVYPTIWVFPVIFDEEKRKRYAR